MSWGIAMCRRCDEPLVATMAFSKAEFYCLSCGAHLGFLDPVGSPETPELLARMEAVKAEFLELGGADLIAVASYLRDCDRCRTNEHAAHATDEEWAAHEAALQRLAARVKAVPA